MVQEIDYDSPEAEVAEETTHDVEVAHADHDAATVMDGDTSEEAEPVVATDAQPTAADDEAARRLKVIRDAPYRAEGFNVYDGRNNRVVICGSDDNRAASGPGLALLIAEVFNRIAGGH